MDALPAVLVLSDEGPQTGTAGGLLLHRLFSGFPAERLRVFTRYMPTFGDPLPNVVYRRLLTPWRRFERSRFNRLKRSLRAYGIVPQLSIRMITDMLEGFAPDVVFCVMQHACYYETAWHFARHKQLPLVVAVHDVNDEFEPVLPWARAAIRRRDARFYRYASCRLCISPEMEQFCRDRYGVTGSVLYPNRSEALMPRPLEQANHLRRSGYLTVGFAGNLNYGYGLGVCQSLPAIRHAGVKLVLYSRPPGDAVAQLQQATDCCEFRGFRPSEEVWEGIQRDCDAVWLPYPNPAGAMERLYRHHFPSKLPEYLALGMPVIVTGPAYATGVRWARNNTLAVACETGDDVDRMVALFQRLATDPAWRRQLAEEGWVAGQRDFDPVLIRRHFIAHLTAACVPAGSNAR